MFIKTRYGLKRYAFPSAFKFIDNKFQASVSAIKKRKHSKEIENDGGGVGPFF